MRRVRWTAVALLAGIAILDGCACAASHTSDGSIDFDADIGPDTAVCRATAPPCTTDEVCAQYAQYVAPPGTFAVSVCGGVRECQRGATDCYIPAFGDRRCLCAPGLGCSGGEVCVSDTPGGPTRCEQACEGR